MTPKVKMYTLSTCSHCKATKKFLDDCTVEYDFIDVDLLPADEKARVMAEVGKVNPRFSFPTIIIGDQVIVGFQEEKIRKALGI